MTKEEMLDTLKLLSALESWSFSNNNRMPDYLLEDIARVISILYREILK